MFSKDEIVEALKKEVIIGVLFPELVRARLKSNGRKADKILEDNAKILSELSGKNDMESFLQAMKKMDENYKKFNNLMISNEELESWLEEYEKELDELEDYV